MKARVFVLIWALLGAVQYAPASLTWRPGEGWVNEGEGGAATAANSRAQLELARKLEADEEWEKSRQAYQALVRKWPFSFNAGEAQFKVGWCGEKLGDFERSFKAYQTCVEKHPASNYFEQALERQYNIANLYLAGEPRRLWKIPVMPSMEKTIEMYEQIIKNAPYGRYAPECQFKIGLAHERKKEWAEAVKSYYKILDRYPGNDVVDDAQYQIGYAWFKAASSADYDQGAAQKAIDAFHEFLTRFPYSEKASQAEENIKELEGRSNSGAFNIAQFYEQQKKIDAAIIYYKEVIQKEPDTERADIARRKIAQLTPLSESSVPAPKDLGQTKIRKEPEPAPPLALEPVGPPAPESMSLSPAVQESEPSGPPLPDDFVPPQPPSRTPATPVPVTREIEPAGPPSPPPAPPPAQFGLPPLRPLKYKSSDYAVAPRPLPPETPGASAPAPAAAPPSPAPQQAPTPRLSPKRWAAPPPSPDLPSAETTPDDPSGTKLPEPKLR